MAAKTRPEPEVGKEQELPRGLLCQSEKREETILDVVLYHR